MAKNGHKKRAGQAVRHERPRIKTEAGKRLDDLMRQDIENRKKIYQTYKKVAWYMVFILVSLFILSVIFL